METLIHRLDSILEPLNLKTLFPDPGSVEVELGSGDGSFLVAVARAEPATRFIGVERLLGRIRKTDRKARRSGLTNVRLVRIEASYFLSYLLPPRSVRAVHVYFPDPWPKRRHQIRRLVSVAFVARAAEVLIPEGRVYLRTDDAAYFEQMQTVFRANPAFREVKTPPSLGGQLTDFERDFVAAGKPIFRVAFQRIDSDVSPTDEGMPHG